MTTAEKMERLLAGASNRVNAGQFSFVHETSYTCTSFYCHRKDTIGTATEFIVSICDYGPDYDGPRFWCQTTKRGGEIKNWEARRTLEEALAYVRWDKLD